VRELVGLVDLVELVDSRLSPPQSLFWLWRPARQAVYSSSRRILARGGERRSRRGDWRALRHNNRTESRRTTSDEKRERRGEMAYDQVENRTERGYAERGEEGKSDVQVPCHGVVGVEPL
jgi:hypothetical protein